MSSVIAGQVEAYILFKRGLGIEMATTATTLAQFVRFADSAGHTGPIDLDIAIAWARSGNGHRGSYEATRYELARRVSDFARVMDPGLPELPRGIMGKTKERVTPYVYTDEEVAVLMSCASRFYYLQDPLKPMSLEFAIGLMRSVGLRPNEALALEDADYDEGERMLTVRLSKNGKTRIVPLNDSVAEAIGAYRERRDAAREDFSCTRLIVGTGSRAVRIWTLDDLFMELRMVLLGRGEMWQRRPPRLMDLRHTFAVRTLLRWHEEGTDVNAMMPVLARYLGHESISETYWYLTGTPELMGIAGDAFEAYFGGWSR